jgi:lipoate-protein ligase A
MTVLIDNAGVTDPAVNQALEEYCIAAFSQEFPCMLLYINDPAVVVGKHQCVFAEVDLSAAEHWGITVIRRISGGGSVYHDHGNLNFSFISPFDRRRFGNYAACLDPVVAALKDLGLAAALAGKSDLHIEGLKISGNAQYANTRSMMIHGTLLFDADVHRLHAVLAPSAPVIAARGVPSVPSPVTCIRQHLETDMDMNSFAAAIRRSLARSVPIDGRFDLSATQWEAVHRLADEKYRRWDWNIGRSPWCRLQVAVPDGASSSQSAVVDIAQGVIQRIETASGKRVMADWSGRRFEDLLRIASPE